jgi:hypothetical protein
MQTEREKYLESELNKYHARDQREQERRTQEYHRQEQERREQREHEMRQADDWPEALRKQIYLCRREDKLNPPADNKDKFFERMAHACQRALKIWREVEASKLAEIEELEQRLEQVHESIQLEVAEKLEASELKEWHNVADSLRNSDPSNFLDW